MPSADIEVMPDVLPVRFPMVHGKDTDRERGKVDRMLRTGTIESEIFRKLDDTCQLRSYKMLEI